MANERPERGNLVFDLDGVIYVGAGGIPGAGPALRTLAESGFHHVFATNAATRTPTTVASAIAAATGYPADPGRVVTSAVAAVALVGDAQPVLPVGEPGMTDTLREAGVGITPDPKAARSVVIGLDRGFTYERLDRAAIAVRHGARLIATNTDATFPTPEGPAPGAGALVAALEAATGIKAQVAGKPHPAMISAVSHLLVPGPVWVVGDRPETDLALGAAAGWGRILVLSGVTEDPAAVPPQWRPDAVISSITDLPAALERL